MDPKQFGLAQWGVVGFFLVALIAAIGILWRQLAKDRRRFEATIKEITAGHDATVTKLVDDHRAEMQVMVERIITSEQNQSAKLAAMTEKMGEVLQVFSRKLDRRPRGGGAT